MAVTIRYGGAGLISSRLRDLVDHLSEELPGEGGGWSPAMDVYETPEAMVIVAELAGVRRQAIKVLIDGDTIRLFGRREPDFQEPGCHFHRKEIEVGSFVRSFRITKRFVVSKVEAHAKDGLLFVLLPKA